MITSIEIAKILIREKRIKAKQFGAHNGVYSSIGMKKHSSFDSALLKLGGTLSFKKEK